MPSASQRFAMPAAKTMQMKMKRYTSALPASPEITTISPTIKAVCAVG